MFYEPAPSGQSLPNSSYQVLQGLGIEQSFWQIAEGGIR
jgi:hypothetical protein